MLSMRTERNVLFAALVALAALSLLQVNRSNRAAVALRASADSMLGAVATAVSYRDSALTAGSSLEGGFVRTATGDTLSLVVLAGRFRILYFQRPDCVACAVLTKLLRSLPLEEREQIAFISYSPTLVVESDSAQNSFSWLPAKSVALRRITYGVPTVLLARIDGRVGAAVHADLHRVGSLLELHGIIPASAIDSLIRNEVAAANVERGQR